MRPALLKTLEEPPGDTVFVLLADDVMPELVTVASRCVEVAFPPVPRDELVQWLTDSGVAAEMAAVVADSSGGNPERARVMVDDPDVAARVALWASVPDELTAAGMTAAGMTRRVLESADRAVEPLRAAHAREIESLTAAAKEMGERGLPGRKEIVEQHQREERRFRTDALRAGLGVLARAYRGRVVRAAQRHLAVGDPDVRSAAEAVGSSPRRRRRCRAIPTRPSWCSRSSCAWPRWRPEAGLARAQPASPGADAVHSMRRQRRVEGRSVRVSPDLQRVAEASGCMVAEARTSASGSAWRSVCSARSRSPGTGGPSTSGA